MKIQTRILLFSMPITALAGISIFFFSQRSVRLIVEEEAALRGLSRMREEAKQMELAYQERSENMLLAHLQSFHEQLDATSAMILDDQGRVISHTNVAEAGKIYTDPDSVRVLQSKEPIYFESVFEGEPILDVSLPLWHAQSGEDFLMGSGKDAALRKGTLRIGLPLKMMRATESRIMHRILWGTLSAILILIGLILSYIQRALMPITLMGKATQKIAAGDLGATVPVFSHDEIGDLARSFNRMSEDLAETTVSKVSLQESEARLQLFQNLIDQSNDSIFVIDPQEGLFLDVNQKACQSTGYTREEMLHLKVIDVDPSIPDKAAWEQLVKEVQNRGWLILESLERRKDGSTFPIEVNVKYVIQREKPYLVAMVRDITERKKLEDQLLQSGKLAAVGELAGGVAHELNNPLGSILGIADVILSEAPPDLKWKKDVEMIKKSAERSKNIVKGLLGFSRRNKFSLETLDIHTVLESTLDLCQHQLNILSIHVVRNFFAAPILISADAAQLQQVFLNIILNAADAMHQGGSLTITTRIKGDEAQIVFADTGPGVPEELLAKIFDPFFTTKEVGRGTGLGLSISLGIIQKHGGRIKVENAVSGHGAVFNAYLPLLKEADKNDRGA